MFGKKQSGKTAHVGRPDRPPILWLCPDGCCCYGPPGGVPSPLSISLGYHRPPADPRCPFCLRTMVENTPENGAAYDERRRERFGVEPSR